jgi:hypothetical protein
MTLQEKINRLAEIRREMSDIANKISGQQHPFVRKTLTLRYLELDRKAKSLNFDIIKETEKAEEKAKQDAKDQELKDRRNRELIRQSIEKKKLDAEIKATEMETERLKAISSGNLNDGDKALINESNISILKKDLENKKNTTTYIIIGAVALVLVVGGVLAYKKFKK